MEKIFLITNSCFLFLSLFIILIDSTRSLGVKPNDFFSYDGDKTNNRINNNPILYKEGGEKEEVGMELYPTGSSLPDCTHACGPCFPCKRVMVSFKCAATESCPTVYRCMCKGKYYHVPSN